MKPPFPRLLQLAVALGGLVPVSAGLAGILLGPVMTGVVITSPGMTGGGPVPAPLDSHFRYLSGLLLGIGLAFWWLIPRIATATAAFRLLTALVVLGGLGRLAGLLLGPLPDWPMRLALVMELGVTPLLCWWQSRVAYASATGWRTPSQ
jgi:hypothetical protein